MSGGYAHSKITTAGGDVKSNGIGRAGKYDLSKRTFAYAGLQMAKNDAGALGPVKTTTCAAGIQHKF